MSPRVPTRARRAFTLIELILVMSVLGIVGLTISIVMPTAVVASRDHTVRTQLLEEASTTLERMAIELRAIPLDTAVLPTIAPKISSVTSTSLNWNTNWALSLSGTNLMLTASGGASTLLQPDVSAFSIVCYNESNTALASSLTGSACYPIRRIQVSITLTRTGVSQSLRSRFFVRSCVSGAGS